MDQPGVVASPAINNISINNRPSEEEKRGENGTFPVLVRARERLLARQVRFGGPVPRQPAAHSPHSRLNVVCLLTELPPHLLYYLYVEQTAPAAAVESRACIRENCAVHFYGFLGFNRSLTAAAFRTTD